MVSLVVHVRVIELNSNVMQGSPEKWYDSGGERWVDANSGRRAVDKEQR